MTLPPGRARLSINPAPTGFPALTMTMGIPVVASRAAMLAATATATITSTLSATNSRASPGRRSNTPPA